MAGFSPRFCTIHLKIHVCPDTNVATKLKAQEDALGYKIRRLHGNQTEADKAADQDKFNRTNKQGSMTALLAKAKATNAKQREETGINDDDMEHGPLVSEENISDRMAKLRNKALGITEPEPKPPTKESQPLENNNKAEKNKKNDAVKSKNEIDSNHDEPIYSNSQVSKMIEEAVELALSKFSKNNTKKPLPKKASPTKAVVKKKTTSKPTAKKTTKSKPAAKKASPTKAVVKKKPPTKAVVKKKTKTKK